MQDASELRRRVKAARQYAGYSSTEKLAAAIGSDARLGARTLRTLEGESAPRPFRPPELQVIADKCGLPVEFFEVDFQRLPELLDRPAPNANSALERRVVELEELVNELAGPDARRQARLRALERLERGDTSPQEAPPATPRQRGA